MHSRRRSLVSWFRRYGLATLAVGLALVIGRFVPEPFVEPKRSPLFLAAILISSWQGGLGPGLLATVLSALAIESFFTPPAGLVFEVDALLRNASFLFVAVLVSWMNGRRLLAEESVRTHDIEVRIAHQIQQRLLPATNPEVPGFDIFGASSAAGATSGDYFDYVRLPGGCLGIVVGDVCGHGLGPALLMSETRAYLRALALVQDDVSEILAAVNRLLVEDTAGDRFVTLFCTALDPRARSFVYASAGQAGYLLDHSGTARRLDGTGMPLGLERDEVFRRSPPIGLASGDLLLLLTDGIPETESRDGTLFGIDRTLHVVRASRDKPSREIIADLWRAVRAFAQDVPQRDDMSAVVLKAQHLV